jgi:hypothetical protein
VVSHGVVKFEEFNEEVSLFDESENFSFFGFKELLMLQATIDRFEGLKFGVGFLYVGVDFLDDFLLY